MRRWNGSVKTDEIVVYQDAHRDRMGDCEWLPEPGDVCLAGQKTGDCFYEYTAFRNGVKVGTFSAYQFGTPTDEYEIVLVKKADLAARTPA